MVNLRDIKRNARRALHQAMSVPAIYIPVRGDDGIPLTVRLHTKMVDMTMHGAESGLAHRRDVREKIVFMRSELAEAGITMKRKAFISVELGEAYQLDAADAPDDITITWFVTPVAEADAVGLPIPVATNG